MSEAKEFVEYMVKQLVDNEDEIEVNEQDGDQAVIIEVRVAKGDYGKIIGKRGKNADALRTLARAVSARHGKRITLEVIE
jgi:predicted RNA-binding protein YlqC (UPF0109 family)